MVLPSVMKLQIWKQKEYRLLKLLQKAHLIDRGQSKKYVDSYVVDHINQNSQIVGASEHCQVRACLLRP